jgi:hypothetical protein
VAVFQYALNRHGKKDSNPIVAEELLTETEMAPPLPKQTLMKVRRNKRTNLMMSVFLVQLFLMVAFAATTAPAQTLVRMNSRSNFDNTKNELRAIAALRRLETNAMVYRSLDQFEADGRLARVTLQTFETELAKVNNELDSLLAEVPAGKFRTEIINAFTSYRDGVFWWRQVDRPRVVHVAALTSEPNRSPADTTYLSTIPYTVAIHWRQAQKYLNQAEKTLGR